MPDMTPVARSLRRNSTDAEILLWKHIRNRQLDGLKFRRQQSVERYVADFICFEKRLIIELDGGQHNENVEDAQRTEFLEARGFIVKRYWKNDVMGNLGGVLQDILQTANTLTPTLSLKGEGEYKGALSLKGEGAFGVVAND